MNVTSTNGTSNAGRTALSLVFSAVIGIVWGLLTIGCGQQDTLTIGTDASFTPFTYTHPETGELTGLDIELAGAVASMTEKDSEIRDLDFDSLIPALAAGEIDMAISAIPITAQREERVAFSEPYYDATPACIAAQGMTAIRSKEDLNDARVGTLPYTDAREDASSSTGQRLLFESWSDALSALREGDIDCILTEEQPAQHIVQRHSNIRILALDFPLEFYGIAVRKDDEKLLSTINTTIAELKATGRYDTLIGTHFR